VDTVRFIAEAVPVSRAQPARRHTPTAHVAASLVRDEKGDLVRVRCDVGVVAVVAVMSPVPVTTRSLASTSSPSVRHRAGTSTA
jgi:hypothetical protein